MAKLNHPPFDAWLLSEETLTEQQAFDLQEHLRSCETCRQVETGWTQVERLVRSAGILAPAAGFGTRWQLRLAEKRAHQHRLQSWLVFTGIAALSAVAVLVLIGVVFTVWQSPAHFIFEIIYRLALVIETLGTFGFYVGDLIQAMPGFSFLGLFFFAGFATLFSVLWLVAFQQLTGARRMVP